MVQHLNVNYVVISWLGDVVVEPCWISHKVVRLEQGHSRQLKSSYLERQGWNYNGTDNGVVEEWGLL